MYVLCAKHYSLHELREPDPFRHSDAPIHAQVRQIVARNNCYILFYGTGHCTLVTVFKDIVYTQITSVLITQTEVSISLHCTYHIRLMCLH